MTTNPTNPVTHLYILIDRSGSMSSIANDVIGGFNQLIANQRRDGIDARVTLVQFDSQDPSDVIVAGANISEIVELDGHTYLPRGGTPLLDATGLLIGRGRVEQAAREATGLLKENIVFVTITDGEETKAVSTTLTAFARSSKSVKTITTGHLSFCRQHLMPTETQVASEYRSDPTRPLALQATARS